MHLTLGTSIGATTGSLCVTGEIVLTAITGVATPTTPSLLVLAYGEPLPTNPDRSRLDPIVSLT